MKISELLNKEERWCKDALARDKKGEPINCLDIKFFDNGKSIDLAKNAYSYSLYGAISKCYEYDDHEWVADKIHQAMGRVLEKDMYIADFNNHEHTTFEDVKKVIKEAGV